MNLRLWLREQGLSVRELAAQLEVAPKTVEDWVYERGRPSRGNAERLTDFIASNCAHHWVIAAPNGPTSEGVCQRCGHQREFQNSLPHKSSFSKKLAGHRAPQATYIIPMFFACGTEARSQRAVRSGLK